MAIRQHGDLENKKRLPEIDLGPPLARDCVPGHLGIKQDSGRVQSKKQEG